MQREGREGHGQIKEDTLGEIDVLRRRCPLVVSILSEYDILIPKLFTQQDCCR